jgi:hypothetical protein
MHLEPVAPIYPTLYKEKFSEESIYNYKVAFCVYVLENKLGWAELNQAETVRLQLYAKLYFQV